MLQCPKHVIKAKDPLLALINVAIPSFLLSKPPPTRTQDAQISAALAARLLYLQEPLIPSDDESKESTLKAAPKKSLIKTSTSFISKKTPEMLSALRVHVFT